MLNIWYGKDKITQKSFIRNVHIPNNLNLVSHYAKNKGREKVKACRRPKQTIVWVVWMQIKNTEHIIPPFHVVRSCPLPNLPVLVPWGFVLRCKTCLFTVLYVCIYRTICTIRNTKATYLFV